MRAFLAGKSVIRAEVGSLNDIPPEFVTPNGEDLYQFYMVRPGDGVAFYKQIGRIAFTTEYVREQLAQYSPEVNDSSHRP